MAFGVFWLVWILVETVRLGVGGLALATFTEMTPPPMAETGGLANAIFGSLLMVSLATALVTPIGILAGVYLAEYGQKTWLGASTRFINDILLSAPSIVIGLFIYSAVVVPMKGFSALAGVLVVGRVERQLRRICRRGGCCGCSRGYGVGDAAGLPALHQHARLARRFQLGKLTLTLSGFGLLELLVGRIDRRRHRLLMLEDRLAEIAG